MKSYYIDGNDIKCFTGLYYSTVENAEKCDYLDGNDIVHEEIAVRCYSVDGNVIKNVSTAHYNLAVMAEKCDYIDGNGIEHFYGVYYFTVENVVESYYSDGNVIGNLKGSCYESDKSDFLNERKHGRDGNMKYCGAPRLSRLQQYQYLFQENFNESTWEATWSTRSAGRLEKNETYCLYNINQFDIKEGIAVFVAAAIGIFLLCVPLLMMWMLPYLGALFSLHGGCCRRKFIRVQKRRTTAKIFEKSRQRPILKSVFTFLLISSDIQCCLGVAPLLSTRDLAAARDGDHFEDRQSSTVFEKGNDDGNETTFHEGITRSEFFDRVWETDQMLEKIREQKHEGELSQTRAWLIDLIRQETQRVRQLTEATTPIFGSDMIEEEVTSLRLRSPNGAISLTMHALRFAHLATRTQRFQLQEMEFMIDLYSRIRFHWRDQLRENEQMNIHYVHRQPYTLDDQGQEALHLILDMNPEQGGFPELLVTTRYHGENRADPQIFESFRNYIPMRRCHDLLDDAGLSVMCTQEHTQCECSTTTLDYMQPEERFNSYWGACIFLDVKIRGMQNEDEGDHNSLMVRMPTRRTVRRFFVYLAGESEPWAMQHFDELDLPGNTLEERVVFQFRNAHGMTRTGDYTAHCVQPQPDDLRTFLALGFVVVLESHRPEQQKLVLADIATHQRTGNRRREDGWRVAEFLPADANKEKILEVFEVLHLCGHNQDHCTVFHRGVLWTGNRPIEDGDYFQIEITNHNEESTGDACRTHMEQDAQRQHEEQGNVDHEATSSSSMSTSSYQGEEEAAEEPDTDDSALLQSRKERQHFKKRVSPASHANERLPPPGNGRKTTEKCGRIQSVTFDDTVTYREVNGDTYTRRDRVINDDQVLHAWSQMQDEDENSFTMGFVRGLRFWNEDGRSFLPLEKLSREEETLDDDEKADSDIHHHLPIREVCSDIEDSLFDLHGDASRPITLCLEKQIDYMRKYDNTIDGLIEALRSDPEAKYPLRQDWESIECLHPIVQNVLAAQNHIATGSAKRLHIFLDGSSLNQNGKKRAAWSFVVGIEGDNASGPNCKLVGFNGAPLASTQLSSYFIGEETCDSGEAECAAMYWAGIWLLSWGKQCMIKTIVHGDNMPTVKASKAEWKCPSTPGAIFEKCRYLWQRIEHEEFPVELRHLHGHKGHPGNEAADSIAKHLAKSNAVFNGKRTILAKKIAMHSSLERLWWNHETTALPKYGSERFFCKGEETKNVVAARDEDKERSEWVGVHFSMATINVFSSLEKEANMTSRRRAMAQQAHDLGWKVVALQETRFRMSIYKKDVLYHMYTASATKSGLFGCELWFAKNWVIAGRKIIEKDIHVLFEEPTMMAVALNHPGLKADFVCVHAPQKQHEGQSAWWKRLHDFVLLREHKGRQVFILGDMNARVGSCYSQGIGRLFAQEECANGKCLRQMVDDCRLSLPSTFPEIHQGSSCTFQRHRLDYIAVPLAMFDCVQKSEVAEDFDMLHCKKDHQPLVLDIGFAVQKDAQARKKGYDKKKASDPSNTEMIEGIFNSFVEPAWEASTDDHSQALAQHVHQHLCKAFPCSSSKDRSRQPYVQGHLWTLVLERKRLRQDIKWYKTQQKMILLLKSWAAWRNDRQQMREAKYHEALHTQNLAFLAEMLENSGSRMQKMVKRDKLQCLQETLANLEHAFKVRDNKKIYEALKPYQHQNARRRIKTPKPLPFLMGDNGVVENKEEWHSAWETHWAEIEGATIKSWEQHQVDIVNSCVNLRCNKKDIMKAVPTLLMVEGAVRGIKKGKAGGIDEICPDVVKLGGPAAAKCIFTLAAKEIVRGQVPLIDKGGLALPLYKHKGPQSARSSFRSIVLENCVGKTISRLWRPELERAFRSLSDSAQGGAKKGMGPVTHILRLRVLQRQAFTMGDSFGIILLDMESAFYKAVRQLVVRSECFEPTDEYAAHISKTLGIEPEEHKIFYQHLRENAMLEQGKANRAVQKWILSSMEGSWCKLKDSSRCLATSLGTKPGDPTADVLYSLVMTKFLREIKKEFNTRCDLQDCIHAMTWVDDVVLPFQCEAAGILDKASGFLEVLHNTATSLGMVPNLKRGKTEVVIGFAGAGAQKTKRRFERMEPLMSFQTTRGMKAVEIVDEATYLGATLEAKGRLLPEIMACTGRAYSSIKPLRKAVLANEKIPMNQRKAVVQSLALSKSNYTIGSWMPMRKAEEKAWRSRTMKSMRLMFGSRWNEENHMSNEEVLVQCGLLSPNEMIETATMRLCSMLAQWADEAYLKPFTDSHATKEETWMSYAVTQLNNLNKKVKTGWPQFQDFAEAMISLRSPKAQMEMNRHIKRYTKALQHERGQRWLIMKRHAKSGPQRHLGEETEQQEFSCPECRKRFKSKAALGVHRNKIHGYLCEAYSYAATTTCFACLGQYFTRERLVQHLQWGSMDCLSQIKSLVEPLTKQQIAFLNVKDKSLYRDTKRQGRRHRNQTKTFCREGIDDITDVTGDWSEFFDTGNMDELEMAEMAMLEDWGVNGPLLDLWEKLPDSEALQEYCQLVSAMGEKVQSAKVMLWWIDLIQRDLAAAYHEEPARSECLATWAFERSCLLRKFL